MQKESLQTQNEPLLLNNHSLNEDKNDKEKTHWIKKRGIEYLREEFKKAECKCFGLNILDFKLLDPAKANAEVLSISNQSAVKLCKVLNLLEITKLLIDEVI